MLCVSTQTRDAERYGPAADPQAEKLYKWEKAWRGWNHSSLTTVECREIARRACIYLKIQPVTLSFHRTPKYSYCHHEHGDIHINSTRHKNVVSVLHEVAHRATWLKYGDKVEWHGKEYVRIYLRLLLRARIAPRVALTASLAEYGVQH